MKQKVTAKFIRESYKNIICIPYCNAQEMLSHLEPSYYTCGVYGWNADIYRIDLDTVIVTGYRPFGKTVNYSITKNYDEIASSIIADYRWSDKYEEKEELLDKNLHKFLSEVM